jgi:predicted ATPase
VHSISPTILLPCADELLTLADERNFVTWRPLGLGFRGWCLSALGQPEQGIPLMIAGLSDIQAILAPLVLTLLGAAHRMASQPRVALKYVTEAVQSAETTSAKWLLSETLRLRGDLLALTGDRIAAEASLHEAIALARYQGAKFFELRSATSLARLWRDQGKIADAQELLAPVYGWFTEGFDNPVLRDARALLDELAS